MMVVCAIGRCLHFENARATTPLIIELAERSAAPLATLDVTLARAAQRENISLIGQET